MSSVLVLASPGELDLASRVWGAHDGSLPAHSREALDWLTLARLMGSEVEVETGRAGDALDAEPGIVIIARGEREVDAEEVAALEHYLERRDALLVARASAPDHPLARLSGAAGGRVVATHGPHRWIGPGTPRNWNADVAGEAVVLDLGADTVPWAFAGGFPLVAGRGVGLGRVATLAGHPSSLRDAAPAATGLLRRLLLSAGPEPRPVLDREGTVVLRLDDPGSCSSVYLSGWRHRALTEREWIEVGAELEQRNARMSACYVPAWLDDGDPTRGELTVAGERVERAPGRIHPSPSVSYRSRSDDKELVHDNESGFRGLKSLLAAGLVSIEQHGYTHVRSDHSRWAVAPDRYQSEAWYRELAGFGEPGGGDDLGAPDPIGAGAELIERFFEVRPTTLSCPGQACSAAAVEGALGAGLELISTLSLGIRHEDRLCWTSHVPAARFDQPDSYWLEAGLPVVVSLHERDIVINGSEWFGRLLDEWRELGATELSGFRELSLALAQGDPDPPKLGQ